MYKAVTPFRFFSNEPQTLLILVYYNVMKILHILPELDEGGVERHVFSLANELSGRGHEVVVVASGGRLASKLAPAIRYLELPVHRKNFFTGIACASRLATLARRERIELMHAHSRVPAWIALFARGLCGVPFVVTAHARYSLNLGLRPFARADGAICVSRAVRDHLAGRLPDEKRVRVIYNAKPEGVAPWRSGADRGPRRMLYLGRLTPKKGIGVLINSLAKVESTSWILDVVGDGPMMDELKKRAASYGMGERVRFHGHSDDPGGWIARSDIFLFPSFDEGMGLSLVEALLAGAPIIASDLPAVRELTGPAEADGLLPPGDEHAWAEALDRFLRGNACPPLTLAVKLPTPSEAAMQTEIFYESVLA